MSDIHVVKIGRVISIDDENDCGRVLAHIKPDDDEIYAACGNEFNSKYFSEMKNNWSWPLLPKYLHVMPKVGEYVLILNAVSENNFSQRYYIGPIIPQLSNTTGCTSIEAFTGLESNVAPKTQKLPRETYGTCPSPSDISIIGKRDSDIQITENDVRLRAGVRLFKAGQILTLNTGNSNSGGNYSTGPGIIKLKYDDIGFKDDKGRTIKSTATIMADRINLIGNNPKICDLFANSGTTESAIMKEDLIPDSEMKKILKNAHELPYGDVLLEYLRLFANAFNTHTHKWIGPTYSPVDNDSINDFKAFNVDTILSDNVRII